MDKPNDPFADFGEFAEMAPALVMLGRLRNMLSPKELANMVWFLPAEVLPGVGSAYGMPVIRADVKNPIIGLDPGALVR